MINSTRIIDFDYGTDLIYARQLDSGRFLTCTFACQSVSYELSENCIATLYSKFNGQEIAVIGSKLNNTFTFDLKDVIANIGTIECQICIEDGLKITTPSFFILSTEIL